MKVDTDLLHTVIAVELVAAAILLVVVVGTTLFRVHRHRRREAARERWLAAMTPVLEQPGPVGEVRLRGMTRRERLSAVSWIVAQMSGEVARRVVASSGEVEVVGVAEAWCRSRLWWRRLRGVRTLTMIGAEQHDLVPMLDDRHHEVRAEATTWVVAFPSRAGVERLVAMLDDDHAWCRFAAEDSLLRLGGRPVDPLLGYLRRPDARRAEIALRVATAIATPAFLSVGLERCRDDRADVRAAAARLVTAIGGDQAAGALVDLLADDDPTVRATAAEGLGTLAHWPSAPLLAERLADPAWDVRRSSAGALRALGAPGRLYLKRALRSSDRFVVDIAQHTLDIPI